MEANSRIRAINVKNASVLKETINAILYVMKLKNRAWRNRMISTYIIGTSLDRMNVAAFAIKQRVYLIFIK